MARRVIAVQNEAAAPPALVGKWLGECDVIVDVVHAYAGDPVPTTVPEDCDGIMAFGGAMGANDDAEYPWLAQERALMVDAVQRGIPVFGVCLGGQLLAAAIGGTVERAPSIEIGVSEVTVQPDTDSDPVFAPLAGATVPAAQWHQDWIAALPPQAVVLAGNDAAPVQAFRVGECAYGVQFHPEVDGAIFGSWRDVADEAAERSGVDVAAASADVAAAEDDLAATWRPLFHRWAGVVAARQR